MTFLQPTLFFDLLCLPEYFFLHLHPLLVLLVLFRHFGCPECQRLQRPALTVEHICLIQSKGVFILRQIKVEAVVFLLWLRWNNYLHRISLSVSNLIPVFTLIVSTFFR